MNDKICKNCKRYFIEEIAFDYPQSCCHISEGHGKTTEPFLTCNEFEYNSEYLEKKVNQLQSNWNSLRKCIIGVIEGARDELNTIIHTTDIHTTEGLDYVNQCSREFDVIRKNLEIVLDKMEELEGVSDE